jgi:hypothetical protein
LSGLVYLSDAASSCEIVIFAVALSSSGAKTKKGSGDPLAESVLRPLDSQRGLVARKGWLGDHDAHESDAREGCYSQ